MKRIVITVLLTVMSMPAFAGNEDKVDICHFDLDYGVWKLLGISGNAIEGHFENHDDGLPEDDTLGTGTPLDSTCEVAATACPCWTPETLASMDGVQNGSSQCTGITELGVPPYTHPSVKLVEPLEYPLSQRLFWQAPPDGHQKCVGLITNTVTGDSTGLYFSTDPDILSPSYSLMSFKQAEACELDIRAAYAAWAVRGVDCIK